MDTYYIKDQLAKVFKAWDVSELPPKKGAKVVVAFPPGNSVRLATITLHDRKSTYGKPLYKAVFSNSLPEPTSPA